jgi:hypothetical protein
MSSLRTVIKLYKKPDCYCCDFASYIEIANTPEQIKEQLEEFGAIETKTIGFMALPDASEIDETFTLKTSPVYVSKQYSIPGNNKYCLLVVEMTPEIHCLEMAGKPSFYM